MCLENFLYSLPPAPHLHFVTSWSGGRYVLRKNSMLQYVYYYNGAQSKL